MRSRLAFDSLWSRAANRADRFGTLSGRERPRIGTSSARVASVWRGTVSDFVLGSYVLCSKPKTKSDSTQMVSVRQAGMPEPRPIHQTLVIAG